MEEEIVHAHSRPTNPLAQIVYLLVGLITLLLALRFILLFLGIDSSTPIVSFIYNTSAAFVRPFNGLFGSDPVIGNQIVEWESLIAMVVVGILGSLIASFVRLLP